MTVTISGTFDREWTQVPPFDVEVQQAEKGHKHWIGGQNGNPARLVEQKPVLTAAFEFEDDGLLAQARFSPDKVTAKNDSARITVDAHPTWSDEQVATALERAGAKFGPPRRDAAMQAIPSKALEPFIGRVDVESVEFRLRHQQPPTPVAELYWVVEATSRLQDGRTFKWEILLEPFEGKLIDLYRYPPTTAELLQKLQSAKTTNEARMRLLLLGNPEPTIRRDLVVQLLSLIEAGPNSCSQSEPDLERRWHSCPWFNAVELTGELKIEEAAPALSRWISWRGTNLVIGIGPEARLDYYPAARALFQIGDPAIPAVQDVLNHGSTAQRAKAINVLIIIHSPQAKAVLRDDLQHEADPDLQDEIKRGLDRN